MDQANDKENFRRGESENSFRKAASWQGSNGGNDTWKEAQSSDNAPTNLPQLAVGETGSTATNNTGSESQTASAQSDANSGLLSQLTDNPALAQSLGQGLQTLETGVQNLNQEVQNLFQMLSAYAGNSSADGGSGGTNDQSGPGNSELPPGAIGSGTTTLGAGGNDSISGGTGSGTSANGDNGVSTSVGETGNPTTAIAGGGTGNLEAPPGTTNGGGSDVSGTSTSKEGGGGSAITNGSDTSTAGTNAGNPTSGDNTGSSTVNDGNGTTYTAGGGTGNLEAPPGTTNGGGSDNTGTTSTTGTKDTTTSGGSTSATSGTNTTPVGTTPTETTAGSTNGNQSGSGFAIQNDKLTINGQTLAGVAVTGEYAEQVGPQALANQISSQFPGINVVRLATSPEGGAFTEGQTLNGGETIDNINQTIQALNAKGIGVIVDNHGSDANTQDNVSQDGNEASWFSQLAQDNATNNMVMFQPENEPIGSDSEIANEQQTAYNAIRTAESQTPGSVQHIVAFDLEGGGGASPMENNQSTYDADSNYVIDAHAYAANSSDPVSAVQSEVAQTSNLTEANGSPVPVYIGETGNSIDGSNLDAQATQLLNYVYPTYGAVAWLYDGAATGFGSGNGADHLTDSNGNLTSYGSQIAGLIQSTTSGGG